MKIVTLGGASQDIFIHHEDIQTVEFCRKNEKESFMLLQEGSKIEIDKIRYSTGGGATNSAVSFKRLGFEVSSFFKIGEDRQGAMILEALKNEGVSLEDCIIDKNGQTGISFIIPSFKGERTVLAFRGSNTTILESELPLKKLKFYSYIYITSLSGDSSHHLLPITKQAKLDGLIVANNPGRSQLLAGATTLCQALSNIDIFILNREEARQLMISLTNGDQSALIDLKIDIDSTPQKMPFLLSELFSSHDECFNLIYYFKAVAARGPKIIVVTNGAEGVYVYSENKIYFHPSFPIKVVNTLGAGDAFGAAFVAGMARFNSIESAIRYGILNSVSVITHIDAKTGLMHQKDLDAAMEKLDISLLSIFKLTTINLILP